ncbi:MAG: cupin domain-containing protein [Thermomicrobiales bacterium]|nr:cupin domain-containing protein [Thermomicrobiales bacterium]MCO5222708.1 cupin domain-containing protein [Thermomicrobiales bacterium]
MRDDRNPIYFPREAGRRYELGTMHAVFKADGPETGDRYAISEWWLAPKSDGPGRHRHDANDEIFIALSGHPSVLAGDHWYDMDPGSTIVIPAGIEHDFANRTGEQVGLLNVFVPGGFEANMPEIVAWYAKQGENRP